MAGGTAAAAALTRGYHLAFWIGAGLVLAAIAIAVTVLQPAATGGARAEAQTAQIAPMAPMAPQEAGR